MKRDWDVIREVLIEIESLSDEARTEFAYRADATDIAVKTKADHALLLNRAGFVEGHLVESIDRPPYLLSPSLTWTGHDLLATLHSKPVWERIKTTAKEKGIELTVDAVKEIGKLALAWVLNN